MPNVLNQAYTLTPQDKKALSSNVLYLPNSRVTNKDTGDDYETISVSDILKRVADPLRLQKDEAPACIASTYAKFDGRSHKAQRQHGEFVMLVGDIDTGNHELEAVRDALLAVVGECLFAIYSTASSAPGNRKWRVLIPLAQPIPGELFSDVQSAFFAQMKKAGITMDPVLARTAQVFYLPNVPLAGDEFPGDCCENYQRHTQDGPVLDGNSTTLMKDAITAAKADLERKRLAEAEAEERRALRRRDNNSPIDWFNAQNKTTDLLTKYGYEHGPRNDWRSPQQQSASYATCVYDDGGWSSLSSSDAEAGLGRQSDKGLGVFGDAFDLFCFYECGNNQQVAFRRVLLMMPNPIYSGATASPDDFDIVGDGAAAEGGEGRGGPEPVVDRLTVDEMLKRFVFCSDGSYVSDLENPAVALSLPDFNKTYMASKVVDLPADGGAPKYHPAAARWLADPRRITVETRTYHAGKGAFTEAPDGRRAFNTWRQEPLIEVDGYEAKAAPFIEHVQWLFGEHASLFLMWLAHIEQQPGVLPHTAWLHIATKTGLGRNWISSALSRVWKGNVAANLDLVPLLEGSFNHVLSGRVLAVVDEVREGGTKQYRHAQRLKQLVTEETRLINPKYGRQTTEWNSCRFLVFSNHTNAITLDSTDRRFNVVKTEDAPRDGAYYVNLYKLLDDSEFLNAVRISLAKLDISTFNAGERSFASGARGEVIALTKSDVRERVEEIVKYWPADVISAPASRELLDGTAAEFGATGQPTTQVKYALEEVGVARYERKVWVKKTTTSAYILKNKEHWQKRTSGELAAECERAEAEVRERGKHTPDHEHDSDLGVSLSEAFDNLIASEQNFEEWLLSRPEDAPPGGGL